MMRPLRKNGRHGVTAAIVLLSISTVTLSPGAAPAVHADHQAADDDWTASVSQPEFGFGEGPVVLVDAAHGNWHTIDGRFKAFAELLRQDGYRVRSAESVISSGSLAAADVFVIANPVLGGEAAEWVLPTPSAFTAGEIDALRTWVEEGGSLLLIADHMPFPGAASDLAEAFDIVFYNGYAKKSRYESGTLKFSQPSRLSPEHPIVRGRNPAESVPVVKSFTGQAFRVLRPSRSLMTMPDDWQVLLPKNAGEFLDDTPTVSARGLVQGATLSYGKGRVAVFGEAAMFTAQVLVRNGKVIRFGMNDPGAEHNDQFVLNTLHWLTGLLD